MLSAAEPTAAAASSNPVQPGFRSGPGKSRASGKPSAAKTIVSASAQAVAVVPLRDVEQNKGGEPSTEKDFETQHSGVFAPPGLPLAHFQLRNPGSGR
jgi:hypothetical protein